MKLSGSRKMWLLMVVGACLVLVQYHLANSWLLNSQPLTPQLPSNMQAALDQLQLQLDDSVVAAVGERVLHDIAVQVCINICYSVTIGVLGDVNQLTPSPNMDLLWDSRMESGYWIKGVDTIVLCSFSDFQSGDPWHRETITRWCSLCQT